ncbi:rCG24952 [Rattus norvegicus]|nr:rCG24952 [Rattus norvegicus]
MCSSGS